MKRNGQVVNSVVWKKIRRPFSRRKEGEFVSYISRHYNGLEFLDTKSAIMRWKMN